MGRCWTGSPCWRRYPNVQAIGVNMGFLPVVALIWGSLTVGGIATSIFEGKVTPFRFAFSGAIAWFTLRYAWKNL